MADIEEITNNLYLGADPYTKNGHGKTVLEACPDFRIQWDGHVAYLQNQLTGALKKPATLKNHLIENSEFTPLTQQYVVARILPDVFRPDCWQGKEKQAIELYDQLLDAAPRAQKAKIINSIDVTSLREKLLPEPEDMNSAVKRYVRSPKPGKSAGRADG